MPKPKITYDIISTEDASMLSDVFSQHRPYWRALMESASIIVGRNKKYTGEDTERDVFKNFEVDARIQGIPTREAFLQWISKKLARILVNDQDYADEAYTDSIRDLANYTLLLLAYELTKEKVV